MILNTGQNALGHLRNFRLEDQTRFNVGIGLANGDLLAKAELQFDLMMKMAPYLSGHRNSSAPLNLLR